MRPDLRGLWARLAPVALGGTPAIAEEVRCVVLTDDHLSVFYAPGTEARAAEILEAAAEELRARAAERQA